MFYWEKRLRRKFNFIAGVDEAGRGPLAGPLVVAAVILKPNYKFFSEIKDSKKLTSQQRERAFREIIQKAWIGIGIAEIELINNFDISLATSFAANLALNNLVKKPDFVLTDAGIEIPFSPCLSLVDGEAKSISIASASIVAKVIRDRIMETYDYFFPQYLFKEHKGYGTKYHFALIRKYGPSPIHRKNFSPIRCWYKG